MVAYSSPLMPECAAHWLRAIPQKRTPARETTPGLRSRRLRMGGSYPAALVTGTATLLRLCLLAPLLPEKCELLHIGRLFFVIPLHRPMHRCGRRRQPRASAARRGRVWRQRLRPLLAQDPGWRDSPAPSVAFPAVIKLQSNRTMVVFRGIIERQGMRHGQATTLGYPCLASSAGVAPALRGGQLRPRP